MSFYIDLVDILCGNGQYGIHPLVPIGGETVVNILQTCQRTADKTIEVDSSLVSTRIGHGWEDVVARVGFLADRARNQIGWEDVATHTPRQTTMNVLWTRRHGGTVLYAFHMCTQRRE